jgi:hypothetical protein
MQDAVWYVQTRNTVWRIDTAAVLPFGSPILSDDTFIERKTKALQHTTSLKCMYAIVGKQPLLYPSLLLTSIERDAYFLNKVNRTQNQGRGLAEAVSGRPLTVNAETWIQF